MLDPFSSERQIFSVIQSHVFDRRSKWFEFSDDGAIDQICCFFLDFGEDGLAALVLDWGDDNLLVGCANRRISFLETHLASEFNMDWVLANRSSANYLTPAIQGN